MAAKKATNKGKPASEDKPLDPVSISTWARIRSAGKAPVGGKPFGAEQSKPKSKGK